MAGPVFLSLFFDIVHKLLQNILFVKIVLYVSSALEFCIFSIHKKPGDCPEFPEDETSIHFCRPMARKGKHVKEQFLMNCYLCSLKRIYCFVSFQPLVQGLHKCLQSPLSREQEV